MCPDTFVFALASAMGEYDNLAVLRVWLDLTCRAFVYRGLRFLPLLPHRAGRGRQQLSSDGCRDVSV